MRKRQIQTQYYRLCQYLCYLYPDLQLCDPYSFLSPGVVGYNESAIGEFLKDQFLACWNHTFQEENPSPTTPFHFWFRVLAARDYGWK